MAFMAQGGCSHCQEALVILRWDTGKRKVHIACPICKAEMVFDLDRLLDILGPAPQGEGSALDLAGMTPMGRPC